MANVAYCHALEPESAQNWSAAGFGEVMRQDARAIVDMVLVAPAAVDADTA